MNGRTAKIIRKLTDNAPHHERRGVKRIWHGLSHKARGQLRRRMVLELRSPTVGSASHGPLAMVSEYAGRLR